MTRTKLNHRTRRVVYEWDYETIDEFDDIIDHDFHDECPGLPVDPAEQGLTEVARIELVLVRNVVIGYADCFDDSADLDERDWAYVKDGKLPETFQDGFTKVPQKFHRELAKTIASSN